MGVNLWLPALAFTLALGGCSAPVKRAPDATESFVWDGSVGSDAKSRNRPVSSTGGMVASDDREASEWGAEILRRGGNAVDAAVATAFMLSVTRPHYASLGGGGFMIFCPKPVDGKAQSCEALDYREKAPAAATRDMYLKDGKPVPNLSLDGALASGVPGVPGGLMAALEKYGRYHTKSKRQLLLSRPIEFAKKGFRFSTREESATVERWTAMNPEARRIFGCAKPCAGCAEKACPVGTLIRQPELAQVLQAISSEGARGFYGGKVARMIVDGIDRAGGILSLSDFEKYSPTWRTPVHGEFRGMEVVSMPPPSAGGTGVIQMLELTSRADRAGALADGYGAASSVHALAHAMVLAFADRAQFFGDPDFVKVPVQNMLDPKYLDERWKTFDPHSAHVTVPAGDFDAHEGMHTTHFSVVDREGNAVAITTTINNDFGSAFVPPGTGVVMNDEMDDFSVQPGAPNLFGLVGAEANSIAAGKRPLSSMSPTIVRDHDGNVRLVVGGAGGPRITTAVFQILVNRLQFNMSLPDAVAAPRFHHQWKPEDLKLERFGFSAEVRRELSRMGYSLTDVVAVARTYSIERFPGGRTWGAPDPRGEGAAVGE